MLILFTCEVSDQTDKVTSYLTACSMKLMFDRKFAYPTEFISASIACHMRTSSVLFYHSQTLRTWTQFNIWFVVCPVLQLIIIFLTFPLIPMVILMAFNTHPILAFWTNNQLFLFLSKPTKHLFIFSIFIFFVYYIITSHFWAIKNFILV